jgi:hypothetical protein
MICPPKTDRLPILGHREFRFPTPDSLWGKTVDILSAIYRRISSGTVVLLGLTFGAQVFGVGGDHPVQNFEYRGSGTIRTHWAATRTESGRIIASGNGLVELRAGQWSQLTTEGNFDWQSLLADEEGRIWAGAQNEIGVFEPDAGGELHYRSLLPLLSEDARAVGAVWNIHASDRGVVFVGGGWVIRTDGKNASSWSIPVRRRLFSWIESGFVFIGAEAKTVFRIAEGGPEQVAVPELEANRGFLWAENLGAGDWIAVPDAGLSSAASAGPEIFAPLN